MVRAILEGRKTQTRRTVKPQPRVDAKGHFLWKDGNYGARLDGTPYTDAFIKYHCPYGAPGDRLWVRETWGPRAGGVVYRADEYRADGFVSCPDGGKWRPSIHMPRWASRITLEIVSVRVERLRDISEEDAIAEGVEQSFDFNWPRWRNYELDGDGWLGAPVDSYRTLWESINGPGSWVANPWVWVVEFKRVEKAGDQ
jgi:hypothetical protein